MSAEVERLRAEVDRLRLKYETSPTACGRGHSNHLPMALWDCPTCTSELLAQAMAVAVATRPETLTAAVTSLRQFLAGRGLPVPA